MFACVEKLGADLGYNWSFHIEIKEKQELIAGGIYRYLKHPYYLGVILELAGVCMIANAFYSLSLVFFVQLPLLVIRIFLRRKHLLIILAIDMKNIGLASCSDNKQ